MALERLLHREAEAPLEPLDALDDPLDVEVEVGQVAATELLELRVDVVGRRALSSVVMSPS